jgi:hypothetical protein
MLLSLDPTLREGGSTLLHCRFDVNFGMGGSELRRSASAFGSGRGERLHVPPIKIGTRQHILGRWLAGMVEKVICEIDLVIVVLSELGEYGHQESRRTTDMICRFFVYSKS